MKKFGKTLLVLMSLLTACKKYPEDPFFSIVSVRNRLVPDNANLWEFVSLTVNGVDSTAQFMQYGCGCYIDIPHEMDHSVGFSTCGYAPCGSSSEWGIDDKKNLSMQGYLVYPLPKSPHPTSPGVFYVSYLTHQILKLYKDELKFKVTHPDNGKEYIFEYKRG